MYNVCMSNYVCVCVPTNFQAYHAYVPLLATFILVYVLNHLPPGHTHTASPAHLYTSLCVCTLGHLSIFHSNCSPIPPSIHLLIALSSNLCYYLCPSAMHTYSSVHIISIPYDECVYPSLPPSYCISLKYSVQTSSTWTFICATAVYNAGWMCLALERLPGQAYVVAIARVAFVCEFSNRHAYKL